MLSEFLVRYLPIVILLFLGFTVWTKRKLVSFPFYISAFLCVVMILAITALPDDYSIDKPRYIRLFRNSYLWGMPDEYKDPGWIYYVTHSAKYLNNNVTLFFLITASVYVFSYLIFARHYFKKDSFYFIVMSMGCLGFGAYATNTIRAGFAISFMMLAFVFRKKIFMLPLMFCAVMLHRSMIIPALGFIITEFINKKWIFCLIWLFCFVLSVTNVDISSFLEEFHFVDYRIEASMESVELYKKGFRLNFLIYSVIPLLISFYNIFKYDIHDKLLQRMVNTYLLANALWLLAIRIHYSDRLAYLSWFLIPFITLYPVIKYKDKYNNPNRLVIGIMSIFMGLDLVLMLT